MYDLLATPNMFRTASGALDLLIINNKQIIKDIELMIKSKIEWF
jgi:hypothetical protein